MQTPKSSSKASSFSIKNSGALFIALAAVCWGFDALFRQYVTKLPVANVVLLEHFIAVLFVAAILPRAIRSARRELDARGWVYLILVGAGASALATLAFVKAFNRSAAHYDYVTPVVLQQTQPLFAVLGARLLLKEKLTPRYWLFFAAAVAAVWLLNFKNPTDVHPANALTMLLALSAAALWALGTVFGRHLSLRMKFWDIAAMRYFIGFITTAIFVVVTGTRIIPPANKLVPLAGSAILTGGLLALMLYYFAMKKTPAAIATISELAFPVTATFVAFSILHNQQLDTSQWLGALILVVDVLVMGLLSTRRPEEVGVDIDLEMLELEKELGSDQPSRI